MTEAAKNERLGYVKEWKFKASAPSESFAFNLYAAPRKDNAPATSLYSDDPAVVLTSAFTIDRHGGQQPKLVGNTRLRLGQLGDWRALAAVIYNIDQLSATAGTIQGTLLEPIFQTVREQQMQAQGQNLRIQPDQSTEMCPLIPPILGVTPAQPLLQTDKRSQMSDSPGLTTPPAVGSSKPILRPICLFNVIVACEWWPISTAFQRQLLWAFNRMSNFLHDVTDGYMALGNVAIGGPSWMDCADIQLLASNRLHPRAWVSAMQFEEKYMPIRVGRGLWNKRASRIMPWDEPEGYRTLVHEWAHHALGLKDRYVALTDVKLPATSPGLAKLVESDHNSSQTKLAVPTISLPIESIMAVIEGTSELVDNSGGAGKSDEWDSLRKRFPKLSISPDYKNDPGPGNLPLPLPETQFVELSNPLADDLRLCVPIYKDEKVAAQANSACLQDTTNTYPCIKQEHCWVFTIRGTLDDPKDLVAYGTLDERSMMDGVALPGAQKNDIVVLIGDGYLKAPARQDEEPQPLVLTARLGEPNNGLFAAVAWQKQTPDNFPLVDVYPTDVYSKEKQYSTTRYQIQVAMNDDGWSGWVFPGGISKPDLSQLADLPQSRLLKWSSAPSSIATIKSDEMVLPSLDGHILLSKKVLDPEVPDSNKICLTIAAYSIGGGPKTVNPPYPNPIPAGSSEGNALLFFYKDDASSETDEDPSDIRLVVTTRNHGIALNERDYLSRSYIFSFAPNAALSEDIYSTLVMFVDRATVGEDDIVELRCYNSTEGWSRKIAALHKTDLSFVAAPLYSDFKRFTPPDVAPPATAPGLFASVPEPERYRLVIKRAV